MKAGYVDAPRKPQRGSSTMVKGGTTSGCGGNPGLHEILR
jgi:hypothetical protein